MIFVGFTTAPEGSVWRWRSWRQGALQHVCLCSKKTKFQRFTTTQTTWRADTRSQHTPSSSSSSSILLLLLSLLLLLLLLLSLDLWPAAGGGTWTLHFFHLVHLSLCFKEFLLFPPLLLSEGRWRVTEYIHISAKLINMMHWLCLRSFKTPNYTLFSNLFEFSSKKAKEKNLRFFNYIWTKVMIYLMIKKGLKYMWTIKYKSVNLHWFRFISASQHTLHFQLI